MVIEAERCIVRHCYPHGLLLLLLLWLLLSGSCTSGLRCTGRTLRQRRHLSGASHGQQGVQVHVGADQLRQRLHHIGRHGLICRHVQPQVALRDDDTLVLRISGQQRTS